MADRRVRRRGREGEVGGDEVGVANSNGANGFATIVVVALLATSIVVETAGNMADMFANRWAWALNIAGRAGALWLRKTWLIVLAAVAILWPIVVMIPLMAFSFGAP